MHKTPLRPKNTLPLLFLRFHLEAGCQIQRVVFQELVRCFGAALVSVRWGAAAYRGPGLAGLWQKWGFHARLGANAVLLIWPASKGPGRSPEPTSASSPHRLTPPAQLGSLPSFRASTRLNATMLRPSSSFNPLPHSPRSATLWTCGSSFKSHSMINIIPPPTACYPAPFCPTVLNFIHLVYELLTRLCLFHFFFFFFFFFPSTHSKNRTKEEPASLFGVWASCVLTASFEVSAPDTGSRKCMWQLDKCLACWPLGKESLCWCVSMSHTPVARLTQRSPS